MKVQMMASKSGKEKLLYELETFLNTFAINWPSPAEYLTNNFTLGSEFVRLSDLPDHGYVNEDTRGLLAYCSEFATIQVDIPGKDELFINVVNDAPALLVSEVDVIKDLLIEIRYNLEGGPKVWP